MVTSAVKASIKGRILRVSVSLPKRVESNGRSVSTGIFKEPVEGRLELRTLNLDGDAQADLTVHGGPEKALYTYASEHYGWWRKTMPDVEFTYGKFGENLTTEGLLEDEIQIGDEFQIGTAIVRVWHILLGRSGGKPGGRRRNNLPAQRRAPYQFARHCQAVYVEQG
jgi:hypothetical protein